MRRLSILVVLAVVLTVVKLESVPVALAGGQGTDVDPLGAEYRIVDVVATFDNTILENSLDPSGADTVYASEENAIGCAFVIGLYLSSYVCHGTLVYFELPGDVYRADIVSATLQLYPRVLPADWNTTYEAAAIGATWNPSTVTWNTQPAVFTAYHQFANPPTNAVLPTEWNATHWVQNWASGVWNNYGVSLWGTSWSFPPSTAFRNTYYDSLEIWSAWDRRPTLHIEYEVDVPDPPTCRGQVATLWGTDAGEVIHGTEGDDVIVALGGADTVYGNGGNDVICAGSGPDTIYGGVGRDRIYGQNGADTIYGNRGADRIEGGLKPDVIKGGNGHDRIFGGRGDDTLRGGDQADKLFGNAGSDRLGGDTGSPDVCDGGVAVDTHIGGCETIISIP